MNIKINGNDTVIETEVSIKELLVLQEVNMPEYVTVQLNDEFVLSADFDTTYVKDGDVIEFLYYMGGGR